MEHGRARRIEPAIGRTAALPTALLAAAACGGDGGPTGPTPEPATGTVEVSAATTGDTLDADGYAVTLDGGEERALDADGTVAFEDVEEGDHEVALSGIQANCAADGGASATVTVAAGETATAGFDVTCEPALFGRIVFHRVDGGDGDLFVLDPDGPDVTVLRDSDALDLFASLSPDGTRVAFQDDSDGDSEIAVMNADGTGYARLTDDPATERNATWSPDGERIAFERSGDIYVMDADGTGVEQLAGEAGASDKLPSWSPDGERVAFESDRDGDFELYVVNADGTGEGRLLEAPATEDRGPGWGPGRGMP